MPVDVDSCSDVGGINVHFYNSCVLHFALFKMPQPRNDNMFHINNGHLVLLDI